MALMRKARGQRDLGQTHTTLQQQQLTPESIVADMTARDTTWNATFTFAAVVIRKLRLAKRLRRDPRGRASSQPVGLPTASPPPVK